jgi:hypothetical protein
MADRALHDQLRIWGSEGRRLFVTEALSILVADLPTAGRRMFFHQ